MRRSIVVTKAARLSISRGLLAIAQDGAAHSVPIEDLEIVVLDHAAIDITAPTLGKLTSSGVVTVVSDDRHLPCGYLIPIQNHQLMAQILRGQIGASGPTKKRLWRTIIREKILAQERLLAERLGRNTELASLAERVKSGDTTNCEGQAASIYFDYLFGEDFRRGRQDEFEEASPDRVAAINSMLNYGYAILRASVCRAIVAAGLNPTLGIFHRHRNNALPLADDLMEPLRPLVDRIAIDVLDRNAALEESEASLTPALKREILAFLTEEVWFEGARTPIDVALARYCTQVRQCLLGELARISVPGA